MRLQVSSLRPLVWMKIGPKFMDLDSQSNKSMNNGYLVNLLRIYFISTVWQYDSVWVLSKSVSTSIVFPAGLHQRFSSFFGCSCSAALLSECLPSGDELFLVSNLAYKLAHSQTGYVIDQITSIFVCVRAKKAHGCSFPLNAAFRWCWIHSSGYCCIHTVESCRACKKSRQGSLFDLNRFCFRVFERTGERYSVGCTIER